MTQRQNRETARRRRARAAGSSALGQLTCLAVALALAGLAGCKPRDAAAPGTVELPVTTTRTADETARSVVLSLRALGQATQRGEHATAARLRAVLLELADQADIRAVLQKSPMLLGAVGTDPIAGYVALWQPLLAYYVDEIDLSRPVLLPMDGQPNRTIVRYAARGKRGESATIDFTCTSGAGGWRVARIQFDRPGGARVSSASAPAATRPASSSAPGPSAAP